MAKKDVHVIPHNDNWGIKSSGKNVSRAFKTQKEAIEAGKQQAKRNSSELSIHGTDGKIREKNSYGNDPRNIKG